MITLTKTQNMGVFPKERVVFFRLMIDILSFMMCRHNVNSTNVVSCANSTARQNGASKAPNANPLERFDARTIVPRAQRVPARRDCAARGARSRCGQPAARVRREEEFGLEPHAVRGAACADPAAPYRTRRHCTAYLP